MAGGPLATIIGRLIAALTGSPSFTNGLKVYLPGDTGLTSDMGMIVHDYYGADLAVINIGDIFTTGPEESAFAITEAAAPAASAIPSACRTEARNGRRRGGRRFEQLPSIEDRVGKREATSSTSAEPTRMSSCKGLRQSAAAPMKSIAVSRQFRPPS